MTRNTAAVLAKGRQVGIGRGLPALAGDRWVGPLLVLLCNLPGLVHATDVPLAQDPDTLGILLPALKDTSLRGLLSWFGRDWSLGNGFYRPLITLGLVADHALWGDWARGYRLTNWGLAVGVALAVRWWLSSLTANRVFGTLAAVVFSLRQAGVVFAIPLGLATAVGAACLAVLVLTRRGAPEGCPSARNWAVLLGCLLVVWVLEWRSNSTLISWIATRTALLGALFCILSLACFSRFHRGGRPAYALLTLAGAAAALASYEQSVALPLAAAASLLAVRSAPRERAMGLLLGMLILIAAYGVLRCTVVGVAPTAYHQMQLKTSLVGSARELANYVLPPGFLGRGILIATTTSAWWVLSDPVFWWSSILLVLWFVAYDRLRRAQPAAGAALLLCKTLLFLPMATLHVFPHYYYLPEAASSGLAVLLLWPGLLDVQAEGRPAP